MNAYLASCTAALVAAAGCLIYESKIATEQSRELEILRARHANLAKQLHAQQELATRKAAFMAAETPAPPAAAAPSSLSREDRAELSQWLVRAEQLKRTMAAHPELGIPELELLTPADWLRVTREGRDPEDPQALRKTLAELRGAAKNQLIPPLTQAFRKYLKQNSNELPPSPLALATYLETPLNPAILSRYEMVRSGNTSNIPSNERTRAAMRETTAIDDEFDVRLQIDSNGIQGRPSGITAWIENYHDRVKQARAAYTRANNGVTSSQIADLAPYITPPLTPAQLEKVLTWERSSRR